MAMKGNDLMRGVRGGSLQALHRRTWLLLVLCALSPYSVESAAAAKVCTTDSNGNTVCHDKLSGGAIAAIVITILLVLLLSAGVYYVVRRTRLHGGMNSSSLATTFAIPALGYSSRDQRRRRGDEEQGDLDNDDDDKYLSVEKNQIQGPAWEAQYDPSSAPLPGRGGSGTGSGSSSWSSRLRSIKPGGTHSGSAAADYGRSGSQQPMSAPGFGQGHANRSHGGMGGFSASSAYDSSTRKPRSAGTETSMGMGMGMVPTGQGGKRHWGSLIHGSQSKNGSRSAGPGPSFPESAPPPMRQVRTRVPPGLDITSGSPGGYYNPPVVPPMTPHTPRTPSRLGTAPPLSAGPMGTPVLASAPLVPRPPRGAGTSTPLTPRPVPAYSPVMTPRGPIGAI
ncbi:hypothetical protein D9757_009557 [Collybiopsis confluens]|uniref:Uncharacterized protein n=1 Tax=Collybiopsis confluens TaxID=2823264 RepID=A0A8H5H8C9_9AGAR|nr:hypothetical protein D9757_009557 [Collybiopsis confluens]